MARKRSASKKKKKKFVIKKPGALTKAVGGKPSENLGKVRAMAKGKGKNAARARFYLNVLKPATTKKKKTSSKRKGRR